MAFVASFSADFSRWNDALKSAQAGLKSFEVSGKGVQRQLENMAKSFSGVEIKKQAEIAVAAVKAVGGVTKLTEAEQRKLNSTVTEAIAKYRALGQQAPADMIALAKATEQVAKPTQAASVSVKQLVAGYVAGMVTWEAAKRVLGGIVDFLKSSIQSYAAAEKATAKLTQALRNSGDASAETVKDLSALATEFQKTTRFSDDLVTEVEALFTQLGEVGPKDMKVAIQAAADLAEGLGIDLEQAATAVSKALQGNDTALRKMAPSLDEAAVKGGNLADIAGEIEKRFGGQAAAALDTYAGRVEQLANQWDNVKESIGAAIVNDEALRALMRRVSNELTDATDATQSLTVTQLLQNNAIAQGNYHLAAALGLLNQYAASANAAADAQTFLNRTIEALSKKTATVSLKGLFPEITSAGLAEWDKQNKLIDEGRDAAKKAEAAYQEWSKAVTGLGRAMAAAELDTRLARLTREGKLTEEAIEGIVKEYETMRPALDALPPRLEAFRSANQKAIVPLAEMSRLLQSLSSRSIPDANAMFKAGQSAVDGLTRSSTLFSRRVVDLRVQMTALPKEVKSYAVSAQDATLREKEAAEAAELWRDNLEDLAQGFALLAQVAPGALGKVASLLGQVTTSLSLAVKGMDSFNDGMDAFKDGDLMAGIAGMASGILGIVSAALALGKAIAELFNSRAEKTVRRIFKELGVSVTEEFAQGIEDTAETIFSGNRQAARIFSLDGLIDQAGGLNAANFRPLIREFRDLFSMIETGAFTAAQGLEVLDANFRTFADFVTKGGSLASKELLEIIKLTERFGLQSAEVASFVVEQTNAALTGLTTFLNNAAVQTQAAADGISAALFGIFEAQARAGVPLVDIIKQLDPLIQKLDAQLKTAGLTGGAAFAELQAFAAVASHEIAGPLITGVIGLEQALAGLHNSGVLNQEMFAGLTAAVTETYAQIQATGVDGAKALQLIGPTLQTIWELQEDFGYAVDEATQALLDEAEAAGVVGDKHRTAQEQMLKLTERMTEAVEYLAKTFGYVTDEVEELTDAVNDIPDPVITPRFNWPDMEPPGGWPRYDGPTGEPPDYDPNAPGYARGGLVPKYMAIGGPSGTDTVPAWLTPGEFVMRRDAVNRIGASSLQSMNSGSTVVGGGNAPLIGALTIYANDARGGREAAEAFTEQLKKQRMLIKEIAR